MRSFQYLLSSPQRTGEETFDMFQNRRATNLFEGSDVVPATVTFTGGVFPRRERRDASNLSTLPLPSCEMPDFEVES